MLLYTLIIQCIIANVRVVARRNKLTGTYLKFRDF